MPSSPTRADSLIADQPGYFPIGVFYQPANPIVTTSFAVWKGRGINTLVGFEQQGATVSIDQWSQAAVDAGLYMIREPRDNIADDINQPNLIAYLQPDEPESKGITADSLQSNYDTWKAADPSRPILTNFDGSRVVGWQGNLKQADYAPYIQAADWVAQDIYPVTGWLNPGALNIVGQATGTLKGWSNKPTFAYIETSNQRLFAASHPTWGERGPTRDEVRGETWDAIIHGANGIMYFTQSFNAFRFDATPIDVTAEMTRQNGIITSLGAVLNSGEDPQISNITFDNGNLEALVKTLDGVTYVIVLNLSNGWVSGNITADGLVLGGALQVLGEGRDLLINGNEFSDSFGPYGVHIYAQVPLGLAAVQVPEPTSVAAFFAAAVIFLRRRGRVSRTTS